jgi:hypothetical protein
MKTKCTIAALMVLASFAGPLMAQTTQPAQEQAPATTTAPDTAAPATRDDDTDYGWIGLLGLLGLIGLAGLMGRRNADYRTGTGTAGTTGSTTSGSTRDSL